MSTIVNFIGPIVSVESDDTAYAEMHFPEDEFSVVKLHKWRINNLIQPANLAFITGKLAYHAEEWIMDVTHIVPLDVPVFMVPPPVVTVFGNVVSFQLDSRTLRLATSDFICKELRPVSATCDLSGPRVDKINSFSASAQVVIIGGLKLPETDKVPFVIAETLSIVERQRAATPVKTPSAPGKRSFLHSQMKSIKEEEEVSAPEKPVSSKKQKSK